MDTNTARQYEARDTRFDNLDEAIAVAKELGTVVFEIHADGIGRTLRWPTKENHS